MYYRIEGPRACGKTSTARGRAASSVSCQVSRGRDRRKPRNRATHRLKCPTQCSAVSPRSRSHASYLARSAFFFTRISVPPAGCDPTSRVTALPYDSDKPTMPANHRVSTSSLYLYHRLHIAADAVFHLLRQPAHYSLTTYTNCRFVYGAQGLALMEARGCALLPREPQCNIRAGSCREKRQLSQ